MITAKHFMGQAPVGWKVIASDSEQPEAPASAAIDGKPETRWETNASATEHYITIDMGTTRPISGMTYLPRQDGLGYGLVKQYKIETSIDAKTWTLVVPSGDFANLRNNPELQTVHFPAIDARFLRFTSTQSYDDSKAASAAEVSVVPAKP
jgi:alpha-L-fucosidase